ncbi:SSI family serine proteinase inhibitor [Paenarthrobacter sp. GOM3]|uniref:SSI family serine proteinase inhibitor n=1 Tax=Paenarthrobacter sp. GOM3 TaxID=2782567 RepID=UPI001BA68570|nr:SSI family serine proteinase inhibitor [Paenarthrobacter sp. GOM3]WOH19267.1 SSI family serine proteinase inhibitor [Paenarthrobacter sp. GOM3]
MRMRFVRPLIAVPALTVLTVAGLVACAGTPTPGSTGSATQAPSSSAPASSSPASSAPTSSSSGNAELSITLMETPEAAAKTFTLVCADGKPAAESKHPSPAEACATIKNNPAILSPTPPRTDQMCTQQIGGPATAKVTGAVDGKEVTAAFSRTDGCQIAMWDAAKSILGSDGGV